MRRVRTPLVVWVALCLAAVSVPAQQPPAPDFAGIESVIRKELQATQTPGAAIAIVMGDRVVYTRGFGVASVETGEAVRPDMLFRLGSTTKMITAAAVVYMAEQGRLGLHEPVSKYVPRLDKQLGSLTVHQLLSHTSGMFDEAPMFGSHDDKAMLPRTTDAAIVAALGPLPAAEPVVAAGAVELVDTADFVGTYSQGARTLSVVRRDGKLLLIDGTRETAMEHVDQRTFRAGTTSYIFVVNSTGAVTFLHSGGRSWRKIT